MEKGNNNEWMLLESKEADETVAWLYEESRKNLKKLREKIGLNQAEFAKLLGVSRAALSYYENGTRTPDIKFIMKVGVLTDCNFDFLLGDSPTMNNSHKFDIAKALSISEDEAEELRGLCEYGKIFRALLSSKKLRRITAKLRWSSEDIIKGQDYYDRVVWECMKEVEQLFITMLEAAIADTKERLAEAAEEEIEDGIEDEVVRSFDCNDSTQSLNNNPLQSFREKLSQEKED